jgi:hypothetical protein
MTRIPQDQRPPIRFDRLTSTVRPEIDNLAGSRFTDMFTPKRNGEWKIMNKVFHQHG